MRGIVYFAFGINDHDINVHGTASLFAMYYLLCTI